MLLRLADPDERYASVRLCSDLPLPDADDARRNGEWQLELAVPPVARLEYELEVVDELVLEWISSADFDRLLVDTVRSTYPPHEHERFLGHFRGLIGQWIRERGATATLSAG